MVFESMGKVIPASPLITRATPALVNRATSKLSFMSALLAVVTIYAAGALAAGIVGVVDDPVDHGGFVPAQGDHQPPGGKLTGLEVDLAARADPHRRRPLPADGFHVAAD